MAQRALVRNLVAASAVAALGAAGTLLPVPTAMASSAAVRTQVIPAAPRAEPRQDTILEAGPGGFLHQPEGQSAYLWTRYADGSSTPLPGTGAPVFTNQGADTVATSVSAGVQVSDLDTGTTTVLHPGVPWTMGGLFGDRALVVTRDASGAPSGLRIASWADGSTVTTPVTGWPDGAAINLPVKAGDTGSVVLGYTDTTGPRLAVLDLTTASITVIPGPVPADAKVILGGSRVGWFSASAPGTLHLLNRSALTAAPDIVQLTSSQGRITPVGLVGDWVVTDTTPATSTAVDKPDGAVAATPLNGGDPVTLLGRAAYNSFEQGPGSLLLLGGSSATDWGVRRITADGANGGPVMTEVAAEPPVPNHILSVALSGGTLLTKEPSADGPYVFSRTVGWGSTPSFGARTDFAFSQDGRTCTSSASCAPLFGTGDGRFTQVQSSSTGVVVVQEAGDRAYQFDTGSKNGTVAASGGRFTVYNGGSPAKQYILDTSNQPSPLFSRTITGSAVSGETLWTAGPAAGSISSMRLPDRKALETVATGAKCVAQELQTAGNWLYWSCGPTGPAGVWDLTKKKEIPVPSGPALLGDGYLVRHDTARGELVLTDFHTDTAVTADLAALPAGGTDDRRLTWSVDPFGGGIAYIDAQQNVHLVDPGVPSSPVKVTENTPPFDTVTIGAEQGTGRWILSQPAASASVTFKDGGGQAVRTVPATVTGTAVSASWNGLTSSGKKATNGAHPWTLNVTGLNGTKATANGSVPVRKGADASRDYQNDGQGSLMTLNSSGQLATHFATEDRTGRMESQTTTSGWTVKALPVPFGDLNGDGCNDTLVRLSTGQLRSYHTGCGHPLKSTSTASTLIGNGWNQYTSLLSAGDLTGDGRPDLVAWTASTGDFYLYQATSKGVFSARVTLATNQKYVRVTAVGDVTGDGNGDLVAYDSTNRLWLIPGAGQGKLAARKLISSSWGKQYNALVGVGDITGDGKPDLVERDTAGVVWCTPGTGSGAFGARVKIASGWGSYRGLY